MQSRKYCLEIFYVGVLIPPAAISVYDTYINIYIDTSVLLENSPLVKFKRNYIRDPSGAFSISSLVRISMMSFPAFAPVVVF